MEVLREVSKNDLKELLYSLDLKDENIYKELNSPNKNGIFQFDGNLASTITKRVSPTTFDEMIAINSLARPGTSSFVDDYIAGRDEKISKYPKPVSDLLQETFGICLYQEQLMSIFNKIGGFSLEATNDIRGLMKKLGKAEKSEKDIKSWEEAVKKFTVGATKNGLTEEEAKYVSEDLLTMSSYSFNKCFSGYSIIDKMNSTTMLSIEEIYKIKNDREYARSIGKISLHNKYNKKGYGSGYSLDENNNPIMNKIVDIRYQGRRQTFRVTLVNGYKLKVTKNHKFPVLKNNFIEEIDIIHGLSPGDFVFAYIDKKFIPTRIESIVLSGEENVYDVEMENPYHTVSVNGILANNSHATAYSYIAVMTLYLSHYFKNYYLASVLQNEIGDGSGLVEKTQLIKNQGFEILPPDINKSKSVVSVNGENSLRLGFSNVKKVSEKAALHIMENQPYNNLFDFIFRTNGQIIRIDAIKALISVGAFDFENENRKKLLQVVENYWKNKKTIKVKEKLEIIWNRSYNNIMPLSSIETSNLDLKEYEIEYYGANLFTSIFSKKILKALASLKERQIIYYSFNEVKSLPKKIPVYIQNIRLHIDKNNNEMAFLQVEDINGKVESLPIFSSFWQKLKSIIQVDEAFLLQVYKKGESILFGCNEWVNNEAKIIRMVRPISLED